ncbi:MAG: Coenzyme F420 hydrogenase/dehydrogenase, beta subunit C-terminal domain, partial [bacterium]
MGNQIKVNDVDTSIGSKLCSMCGLCMVDSWTPKEARKSCVFTLGWLGSQEEKLFGRERSLQDTDEMLFGISQKRFVARMKKPLPIPRIQFTGIITSIARRAFESGLVEAVATLKRSKEEHFFPVPILARSLEEINESGGSKPVLAQTLVSLEEAFRQRIQRLLLIGAPCHVHNAREFQGRFPYLKDIDLYVVGIPCTDNVHPKNFRFILSKISSNHETVCHYEFMQDFTVHLRHFDGTLERVPFFSLPQEISSAELLTACCRSCFDHENGLSDITVGYSGAPLDTEKMYQWVIVRTEKGETLRKLIADEMETYPETSEGDRKGFVAQYIQGIRERMGQGKEGFKKSGRAMSIEDGLSFAEWLYSTGPKGLEFVRYGIE